MSLKAIDHGRLELAKRVTIHRLRVMKERGERIVMVTAYDYTQARIIDSTGIPVILVGDSLGNVVLGFESTIPVTVDDIVRHTAAVVRGASFPLIVADMPFMSYHVDEKTSMYNAGRIIQEGGAQAVKIEGGLPVAPVARRLVDAGIAVMGHIGLTPQSVHQLGGYRIQGRELESGNRLISDALAIEDSGAFALVLELIPAELAEKITERLHIPTIGIGAGSATDGQVQVLYDMLGLTPDFKPRHAGNYAEIGSLMREALERYSEDVKSGLFPADSNAFHTDLKYESESENLAR